MILIADSGGTKTEWRLVSPHQAVASYTTQGINAYFHTEESIGQILKHELFSQLPAHHIPTEVHFYGAGCAMPEKKLMLTRTLQRVFPAGKVSVEHDLLGACRALCGDEAGIVCILGTGSNACMYDGDRVISDERSLGFILGDEGSGAYLGKQLVTAFLQKRLPPHIAQEFQEQYKLTRANVLENVYRSEYPNRYLARFSQFFVDHLEDEDCYAMVFEGFAEFLDCYVCTIPTHMEHTINCSGSIAYHYRQVFERVLWAKRMRLGKVVQTPIDGLLAYHTQKS